MNVLPTKSMKKNIQDRIIRWYDTVGRDFPWRYSSDPYKVLIAEMLLRRTTASAVARVYSTFIERFDSPEQLALATPQTIISMIDTLGLQNLRAQHLHKAALSIVKDFNGTIPDTIEKLANLPGVGVYVASAVLNFAFQKFVPLVDGNVIHLLSRLFGTTFAGPTDRTAWDLIGSFEPEAKNKAFYWGIIDLVATVCLRHTPRCERCPLQELCAWRHINKPELKSH